MNEIYALFLGFLLRLGIPILFTGGLIYLLNRLDERWQNEAMQQESPTQPPTDQPPCWIQQGCSTGQILNCPAVKSAQPCWQVYRKSNGYLAEKCLDCQVFISAPVPAHVGQH